MVKVKRQRLRGYMLLMRLDKPIGIMLLLWPTLWALWIASEGNPDWWVVTVFAAGVFLMRSAGRSFATGSGSAKRSPSI